MYAKRAPKLGALLGCVSKYPWAYATGHFN